MYVCTVCTCHYHSTICMSVTGFLTLTAINDLGGVQSDMTDDQTAAAEKKGRRPIFISYTRYFIDFIFYSVFILLFWISSNLISMYVHICMYICMYVCMYLKFMYVLEVSMYVRTYAMYVYINVCTVLYCTVCMYAFIHETTKLRIISSRTPTI